MRIGHHDNPSLPAPLNLIDDQVDSSLGFRIFNGEILNHNSYYKGRHETKGRQRVPPYIFFISFLFA